MEKTGSVVRVSVCRADAIQFLSFLFVRRTRDNWSYVNLPQRKSADMWRALKSNDDHDKLHASHKRENINDYQINEVEATGDTRMAKMLSWQRLGLDNIFLCENWLAPSLQYSTTHSTPITHLKVRWSGRGDCDQFPYEIPSARDARRCLYHCRYGMCATPWMIK